jgi:hypothetical protein
VVDIGDPVLVVPPVEIVVAGGAIKLVASLIPVDRVLPASPADQVVAT